MAQTHQIIGDRALGFTLIEVVLALSLAIAAVGAMLGFYQHVLQVRGNVLTNIQAVSSQRLVMERVTDELRGAMVYPFLQMGLQGQAGEMTFMSAVVPGADAWAVRDPMQDPKPPQYDLQMVTYRLRIERDEQGNVRVDDNGRIIVDGLERTCQKVLNSTAVEGQEIAVTLLTPYIKFLNLRYWDGAAWATKWSGRDLPLAVEITLGSVAPEDGKTPDQYSEEVFRRVIYVPGGTKAMGATTIIRGLDTGGGL